MGLRSQYLTDAAGVMRARKINAALDNKSFKTPRANESIGNLKSNHVPKIANVESKPMQVKRFVTKTKIVNMETNNLTQKIALKQELKRVAQKYPGGIKKVAVQKKSLVVTPKTKTSKQLAEERTAAPKINKINEAANQIQKVKPQEKSPAAAQNTKLENDISPVKNNTPVQDTTAQENTTKLKSPASEVAPNSIPTQEKKTKDTQKDVPAVKANTSEAPAKVEAKNKDQSKKEDCIESSKDKLELEPLLARVVEEELQDIMIQVWRELPDEPSEEDRPVVDALRNEAGDDFRRVLGLNITKRLLNVHNNLFVKMQFTCRPQMGCLTSFLNEYHITKFKRIDSKSNTFAAEMENIEDFDKICAVKEIKCGEANVRITPCYKFTECPKNLKTIYDDTYFCEDIVQENVESSKSKNNSQKPTANNLNKSDIKPAVKLQKDEAKPINKPERAEIQEKAESLSNDTECIKKDSEKVNLNTTTKPEGTETQKSTDLVSNNPENVSKSPSSAEKKNTDDSSKMITDDTSPVEKEVTKNISNEKQTLNDIAKYKDISDYIIKDTLESDDDDFDEGVPEYEMEGDEELDDEDILALMSEGVVLDECSGSEDEKGV